MPCSPRDKNEGARTVVRTGEKSLLSDPGSEFRPGREKEKEKVAKITNRMSKKKRKQVWGLQETTW